MADARSSDCANALDSCSASQPFSKSGDVPPKPLCVDLDGTLVKTDVLLECALTLALSDLVAVVLGQCSRPDRAALKRKVAGLSSLRPELLPYNTELLAFLRHEKERGRRIILVTAADVTIAKSIADHLGLFDDAIASDGARNMKGAAKARELVHRYGRRGFDYAGNGRVDLAVWSEADGIILVDAPAGVDKKAATAGKVIARFNTRPRVLSAVAKTMRPHQWVKNLLVFVPLLTSHSLLDLPGVIGALLAFAAFCATASGVYLINDLADIAADRAHPRKRRRPLASGDLPLAYGMGAIIVLLLIGTALSIPAGVPHLVALYAAASTAYSVWLKRFPLLDVFVLSALYTLRIVAGGVASGHLASMWLLGFSGFAFLSLAFVKRCAELPAGTTDAGRLKIPHRGYFPQDRPILSAFGTASAFAASVVLALFVGSTTAIQQYKSPELLWGLVPLILFWHCRLWLSTERGHMHDDPIIYASRDWVSWLVALASIAIVVLAASVRVL